MPAAVAAAAALQPSFVWEACCRPAFLVGLGGQGSPEQFDGRQPRNGVEVARLGRLRKPGLPMLFITGFADTAVLAAQANSHHILQKPFYTADWWRRSKEHCEQRPDSVVEAR